MKTRITDGLQIILAILITGSLTVYAAPVPSIENEAVLEPQSVSKVENVQEPVSEPKTAPEPSKKKQKRVFDPNGCEPEQYWAKEAPYECIPKKNQSAASATTKSQPVSVPSGNKEQWMAAAGIPQSQWGYVDSIVSRESGWDPCAYNPGLSDCGANPTSACGLAQSLPCGKQSKYGHWTDPVANLKWQYEYVTARYGGYAQAVAFWNSNHWY